MDSEKPKTPQEELEELLRQAGGQTAFSNKPQSTVGTPRVGGTPMVDIASRVKWPTIDRKWILVGSLALVLLFGTIFFLAGLVQQGRSGVLVQTDQPDIMISIGDKEFEGIEDGDKIALAPGEYRLRAQKTGYLDYATELTVDRDRYTSVVLNWLTIPELKPITGVVRDLRLNSDGKEISYFDSDNRVFQTRVLEEERLADLFRGKFDRPVNIVWSPTNQAAMVQLRGVATLPNMEDNRKARGRYLPLGESPEQAPTLSNGIYTWFFNDALKTSAGWQPVLLTENVRQVAFSADGSEIIYIYEGADGEYSLVRSQPEGLEWERVITDMPRFGNPQLSWGPDNRYLFIEDQGKIYVADLFARTVEQVLADWVVGSDIAVSPMGGELAYIGMENGVSELKLYDLLERSIKSVMRLDDGVRRLLWSGFGEVLVALPDQAFGKIDISTGVMSLVPFSGAQIGGDILDLHYSSLGRTLVIESEEGAYFMKM